MPDQEVVQRLLDSNLSCYFISPHLDDAVFSAGGLMTRLQGKIPVQVINVFTRGGVAPYSLSEKAFLRQTGYADFDSLYEDRVKEDAAVFERLGVPHVELGYMDSLCRPISVTGSFRHGLGSLLPELNRAYPIYRFHGISGKLSKHDEQMMKTIEKQLLEIVGDPQSACVFCPLGIGGHVDHVLVREVCRHVFPRLVYWSDFPYVLKSSPDRAFVEKHQLKTFEFGEHLEDKVKLMQGYVSQVRPIFGDQPIPLTPEIYYHQ